jgi:hypothetical protein
MWKFAPLVLVNAFISGCLDGIERHCVGCEIVLGARPVLPARKSGSVLVILVPGAFGFNGEWRSVLDALRRPPALPFWVFHWPGPWRTPSVWAKSLTDALQKEIDRAKGPLEMLILAHSAGGLIGIYAARHLRLPPDVRLRMVSLAAPEVLVVRPYHPSRDPNTPFGFAIGGEVEPLPRVPSNVEIVEYVTENRGPPAHDRGVHRVYVGTRAGHNRVIGQVALPMLDALRRRAQEGEEDAERPFP